MLPKNLDFQILKCGQLSLNIYKVTAKQMSLIAKLPSSQEVSHTKDRLWANLRSLPALCAAPLPSEHPHLQGTMFSYLPSEVRISLLGLLSLHPSNSFPTGQLLGEKLM